MLLPPCPLRLIVALSFSFAIIALSVGGPAAIAQTGRPNIVLIMADDLGVETLGSYGGLSYETPHLDDLAAEGIRFTHAYAQPLCTNTRLQLMTGLYNNRNWRAFGILDPTAKTFGHYMRAAGYETCMVGKWQLQSYDPPDYPGAERRRGSGMRVEQAGFDEYSMWHTSHTEDKGSRYADPVIYENGRFRDDLKGRYGPDVWVDYICDYVRRKQKSSKPFFLYYSMALPHWPMVPTPDSAAWSDPRRRFKEDDQYFGDMVAYTDKCVGRVVRCIDDAGLQEDTLILFFSDNGTHLSITSDTVDGRVQGGKGLTTDAGTHVPLIARWTGTIAPGVNDDLIDSTDFLPTIREAARRPLPDRTGIDGVSFYPRLLGQAGRPRAWIFCHFDPRPGWDKDRFRKLRFARDRRYKLYSDGRFFDTLNDRLEESPIRQVSDMSARLARHRLQAVLDQMPDPPTPTRD